MTRTKTVLAAVSAAFLLLACGGGGGADPAATPAVALACATSLQASDKFPAWQPGATYADLVAGAVQAYAAAREDWRLFSQKSFDPQGDYLNFAVSTSFETLGPTVKWGDDGVPMVLNDGQWVYNPVTVANFALYVHSRFMREKVLDPAFWAAVARLQALQSADGAFRYSYAFSNLKPGWVSGLAQGLALSVFSRAYALSGDQRYLANGTAALNFLLTPLADGGVRSDLKDLDPSLARYLFLDEYSGAYSPHTLNGFMFTALGLHEWAALGNMPGAPQLQSYGQADAHFTCAVHSISSVIQYYDLGGYSAYDMRQVLAQADAPQTGPAHYHAVHIGLALALNSIAPHPSLLAYARKWADAVGQPLPAN